jgi:hypothetical protein
MPLAAIGGAIAGMSAGTAAAIGLAGTVISAGMSYSAQKKQQKAQQAAAQAQSRANNLEAQRARIAQVREARIRRANIIQSGTNSGLGAGSSGIVGATGSVSSQTGNNLSNINVQQDFANIVSSNMQSAVNQQAKAQTWQSIGGASKSIFDNAGGFTTIFGGNTAIDATKVTNK